MVLFTVKLQFGFISKTLGWCLGHLAPRNSGIIHLTDASWVRPRMAGWAGNLVPHTQGFLCPQQGWEWSGGTQGRRAPWELHGS